MRQRSSHQAARGVAVAARTGVRAALGRAVCDLTAAAAGWLRSRWAPLLVLVSAVASVPPLMLLAVAAGVAQVPVRRFAPACVVGRTARFAVVVLVTGAVAQ